MKAYSTYWRKNVSRDEPTELALCLRALRKVAGHLGRNIKPVYWKGMVEKDNRSILLDPLLLKGEYPIPFHTIDVLAGQVVLEGLSSLEWREWVIESVMREAAGLSEETRPFLLAIIEAGEDIYAGELAKPHVWAHYFRRYWQARLAGKERNPSLPPTAASLADAWRKMAIMGWAPPQNLHPYSRDFLDILACHTSEIRKLALFPAMSTRRNRRKDFYLELWSLILAIISGWKTSVYLDGVVGIRDTAGAKGKSKESENKEEEDTERAEYDGGLESDVLEEVNAILAEGKTDLTDIIRTAVVDPEAASMKTVLERSVVKSDIKPDQQQVMSLEKIFREQDLLAWRLRKRQTRRALLEGKLDGGRLFRVSLDGKVFKSRGKSEPVNAWRIAIVADASASMTGKAGRMNSWQLAERVFASLAQAVKGSRNALDIYAYHEDGGVCSIMQLYYGGEVYSTLPAGRTPTGQAILSAAMMMSGKYEKRMIIHITDGAANCGVSLGDALAYCNRNNIMVFTIGCGCNRQTRDFLASYFPAKSLFFMKDMGYLSVGLAELFKQNILKH